MSSQARTGRVVGQVVRLSGHRARSTNMDPLMVNLGATALKRFRFDENQTGQRRAAPESAGSAVGPKSAGWPSGLQRFHRVRVREPQRCQVRVNVLMHDDYFPLNDRYLMIVPSSGVETLAECCCQGDDPEQAGLASIFSTGGGDSQGAVVQERRSGVWPGGSGSGAAVFREALDWSGWGVPQQEVEQAAVYSENPEFRVVR